MKHFGNNDGAMLDLKTIKTCSLIIGLDFNYRIMLCFQFYCCFYKELFLKNRL